MKTCMYVSSTYSSHTLSNDLGLVTSLQFFESGQVLFLVVHIFASYPHPSFVFSR